MLVLERVWGCVLFREENVPVCTMSCVNILRCIPRSDKGAYREIFFCV